MKNSLSFLRKLFSTFLCCFLIVLAVSSCDRPKDGEKKTAEEKAKEDAIALKNKALAEVETLKNEALAEIETLKNEGTRLQENIQKMRPELELLENQLTIVNQSKEIIDINNRIILLENAKFNIEKTLKKPLLQTNIKYPLVKLESLGELEKKKIPGLSDLSVKYVDYTMKLWKKVGWDVGTVDTAAAPLGYYKDYVLVVIDFNIDAKFGVDLDNIKFSKIDGSIVTISGIHPDFIETSKNTHNIMVSEVRRCNYNKKRELSSIKILDNAEAQKLSSWWAAESEKDFQQSLSAGTELPFMEAAVNRITQAFITATLAPIYKDIKFSDVDGPESLPIVEYLQKELTDANDRKNKLLEANRILTLKNEMLTGEVDKIKNEQ
jgi:hypothetical protein